MWCPLGQCGCASAPATGVPTYPAAVTGYDSGSQGLEVETRFVEHMHSLATVSATFMVASCL